MEVESCAKTGCETGAIVVTFKQRELDTIIKYKIWEHNLEEEILEMREGIQK